MRQRRMSIQILQESTLGISKSSRPKLSNPPSSTSSKGLCVHHQSRIQSKINKTDITKEIVKGKTSEVNISNTDKKEDIIFVNNNTRVVGIDKLDKTDKTDKTNKTDQVDKRNNKDKVAIDKSDKDKDHQVVIVSKVDKKDKDKEITIKPSTPPPPYTETDHTLSSHSNPTTSFIPKEKNKDSSKLPTKEKVLPRFNSLPLNTHQSGTSKEHKLKVDTGNSKIQQESVSRDTRTRDQDLKIPSTQSPLFIKVEDRKHSTDPDKSGRSGESRPRAFSQAQAQAQLLVKDSTTTTQTVLPLFTHTTPSYPFTPYISNQYTQETNTQSKSKHHNHNHNQKRHLTPPPKPLTTQPTPSFPLTSPIHPPSNQFPFPGSYPYTNPSSPSHQYPPTSFPFPTQQYPFIPSQQYPFPSPPTHTQPLTPQVYPNPERSNRLPLSTRLRTLSGPNTHKDTPPLPHPTFPNLPFRVNRREEINSGRLNWKDIPNRTRKEESRQSIIGRREEEGYPFVKSTGILKKEENSIKNKEGIRKEEGFLSNFLARNTRSESRTTFSTDISRSTESSRTTGTTGLSGTTGTRRSNSNSTETETEIDEMANSGPPRMLILSGGGTEALLLLPPSYDKALAAAYEKLGVNKNTHDLRLTCKASEIPWIGPALGTEEVFIADNDSFHYACAGKAVVRLGVVVFDKNVGKGGDQNKGGATVAAAPPAPASGSGEKKDKDKEGGGGGAKPSGQTADVSMSVETTAGKGATLLASLSGELSKGLPPGDYLGTLTVEEKTFNQQFVGRQLGPNEVLTKYVVHDKNTARLLFRPRSLRPQIDLLYPEEKSVRVTFRTRLRLLGHPLWPTQLSELIRLQQLEVSLSVQDWQIVSAYPMTSLQPDGPRQRLRWFLKVKGNGTVEDLLTGTETSGLFVEMLPVSKPRPTSTPAIDAPLIPSWPDIRPQTAWCLPQTLFIPHIDRVLQSLGLPVESRTAMIISWLPGITRHKNIAYKILGNDAMSPSSQLNIIPPPDVLIRIFILFKGIPDGEMKSWQDAGIVQAEMGLDWRGIVGYNEHLYDENKFRVFEYGAMEVFD
ncbi:hypothetical protein TREMEDRAFT_65285 [Tremella mesenterica DSM 1558]|nr:uncharacterized protein TREMEDRAFT_65285 [Tremella mesenterica DSM 1558]EIW66433.1 hypothetical protein TREMEDRAFT_65285 [Tremella mesenterica DSM 1558]